MGDPKVHKQSTQHSEVVRDTSHVTPKKSLSNQTTNPGIQQRLINSTLKDDKGNFNFEIDPIASFLVVGIFLLERILTYLSQRRLNRNLWYLELIIKPNQEYIDKYFEEVAIDAKKLLADIKRDHSTLTNVEFSRNVARSINSIKVKCREIESKFLDYTVPLGDLIYENLLNDIQNMKDKLSNGLDHSQFLANTDKKIDSQVQEYKARFYRLMYLPIKRGIFRTTLFNIARPIKKIFKR